MPSSPGIDWVARATAYAREAAADTKGKKFCKWVRLAGKRFLDDLKRAQHPDCAFYMDAEEAGKKCRFDSCLPHIEGEWGSPTLVLEDWQIFKNVNIWGFRKKENGKRRFDTVYEELARKNAKSTTAAADALYCGVAEGEPGAQVKCAATTGDQARIVFDVARKMVEKLPALRTHFNVKPFTNTIVFYGNGGNMRPINAKASTQDGLNPHCTVLDELHAHKDRALFDVLKSARGARKNPLSLYITTAGYDTEGVCYEQRKLVCKILEGLIEADHYWGIIYTLDEDDDVFDETKWIKANPNLGVSVQLSELRSYALEAKLSPETLSEFKTKRLNIWTTARSGYINLVKWKQAAAKTIWDWEEMALIPCWGAFDLASTQDLTAFRLVWELERTLRDGRKQKYVRTWGRFYLPEAAIDTRTDRSGVPYRTWYEKGFITKTPGDATDYDFVERDIRAALTRFNIQRIAYDDWQAAYLVSNLMKADAPLAQFIQGTRSYNAPMRELERLYLQHRFEHENNPVLNWNASNLVARRDLNDNLAPDKRRSLEKIDGIVALLMALGIMIGETTSGQGESVYESRGLIGID